MRKITNSIKMKNFILTLFISFLFGNVMAQQNQVKFVIETPHGNMTGVLYNETPEHRDNFVKLVKEGWYDGSPFHRIIKDFMIQGGQNKDGRMDPGYKVPAEFIPTKYIHKKGALAAARQADNVNPTKASSGSQFYVVQGKVTPASQLVQMEQRSQQSAKNRLISEYITRPENAKLYQKVDSLQRARNMDALNALAKEIMIKVEAEGTVPSGFKYSNAQKTIYSTIGGTPFLDGEYTVFGEIIDGLEVIEKLSAVKTAPGDRPIEPVSMKIRIL